MTDHLDTLRAIVRRAQEFHTLRPIDEDLVQEAGMDGNLQRLLQAARELDEVDFVRELFRPDRSR